jgi:hypothetical protein
MVTSAANSSPISRAVRPVVVPLGTLSKLVRELRRAADAPLAGILLRGKVTEVATISLGARFATGFLLEIVMPSALLKYLASVPIANKPATVIMEENKIVGSCCLRKRDLKI